MTTTPAVQFELGRTYSRKDIGEMLGGGSQESYLPSKHWRVICGCFDRLKNPEAPEIVLVGWADGVRGPGIQFAAQRGVYVPIFVKQGSAA